MITAFGTTFQNPIVLAAGTAGFGRELSDTVDLDALGGVITKSVSVEPRAGHPAPRVAEFPGGMLNAIGLANPGVAAVTEQELPWLSAALRRARVLVSVVGNTVEDYARVVRAVEDAPAVVGCELNLSCPNTARGGEHFGADTAVMEALVAGCRSVTGRALVVKLAPTLPDIARTARAAVAAGADGVSAVNTIPGFGALGAGQGGVSGPPLLPVGLLAVRRIREAVDVPIIGMGGVRTPDDVEAYLAAGATLVAIGTAAMADPRVPERLARAWSRRRG